MVEQETPLDSRTILSTRVHCANYETGLRRVIELARGERPAAVSACNTHLVSLARNDVRFHRVMQRFDLIVPDGFPLVWSLNAAGAKLQDRVYGPYFMRHVLANTPAPWKHFFFGGTPQCLERLVAAAKEIQPDIDVADVLSPPFRQWTEHDEQEFARRIRESGADFIWVALGGERQERWIVQNLHRHSRGVFFGIGDAFELLGGGRAFAPEWMQKKGLTWLYRLVQEPRRLWARYFKYNSLFLYFTARDKVFGLPERWSGKPRKGLPSVAFLGSRGVPARYSGFEVVVEQLGARLAEKGHAVTVYNRFPRFQAPTKIYRGMVTITLPTIPTKTLDTIAHTFISAIHAIFHRYDIIYLCGVGNAIIGGILRAAGMTVIINVDGADFRRQKWGSFARMWLRMSERWATMLADAIIADNHEIVYRYEREYKTRPLYLSYGCIIRDQPVKCGELEHWKLEPRRYLLFVSRLTPENEADLLLRAYARTSVDIPLVICGGANYEQSHLEYLKSLATDRVIFTGARYGDSYLELSQNALFFVMPASIEATRLVLLDQMGMGSAILYNDCLATREVVGDAAEPFDADNAEEALAAKITYLADHPAHCAELGRKAMARAKATFDWNHVVDEYERLFEELGVGATKPAPTA